MGWEKDWAPGTAGGLELEAQAFLGHMGWWVVMVEKDGEAVGAVIRSEPGILVCVRSRVVRGAGV